MKAFISVDIEGATGISSFSQCSRPDSAYFDYPFARRMLTHDVNAAIRGLRSAGATRIVVKDSHATCKNLLVAELEPGTELISGNGAGKDGMMAGIDESFDASLLIGYHGMAGTQNAFMEHALVGGLHKFWINGKLAGEVAVSAAVAGAYGVPTILVTGDESTCEEAIACASGVHTFSTKRSFGKFMGKVLHPSETGPGIEAAAQAALLGVGGIDPYRLSGSTTMRLEFREAEEADLPAQMAGVKRLDGYTLEWSRADFLSAHDVALTVFSLSQQGRRSGN